MKPFELVEPTSLEQAIALLDPADPSVRPAGGCTALMLMMKAGMLEPSRLVSLRRVEPRYRAIEADADALCIGAMCTLATIEQSPAVARALPALGRALHTLANVRVRNVATLGGCLAHADPHMDLPPLLIALGARVVIIGRAGSREIALEQLISGYYETTLEGGELIAQVRIPRRLAGHCVYRKVTARSADDWPTLGVAVALDLAEGAVREGQVVLSAAFDRPTRLPAVEGLLHGARIDESIVARAGDAAAAEAQPIADGHGSAAYKRELVRVHVRRALREASGLPPVQVRS